MKFTGLFIENFLTIGSAKLNIADKGLVLIQGENQDDPSAQSNGAGKSSIPDALCWALYGMTARGVTGDAVVNKTAGKDTLVEVQFIDGDDEYMVVRSRKHATHKNSLIFLRKSKDPAYVPNNLSKGTDRETQVLIEQVIGSSYDVFKSSVYAGQEAMPDLPGMTDKQLKLLIEEASGVERLSRAYDLARAEAAKSLRALDDKKVTYDFAVKAQIRAEARTNEAGERFVAFEAARAGRREVFVQAAKTHAESAKKIKATIDDAARVAASTELSALHASLSGRDEQTRIVEAMSAEFTKLDRALSTATATAKLKRAELDKLKAALLSIDSKVGVPCGECGKPYCEHDLEEARKIAESKVKDASDLLTTMVDIARIAKEEADKKGAEISAFRAAIPDVSAVIARQAVLNEIIAADTHQQQELAAAIVKTKECVTRAKEVDVEVNPHIVEKDASSKEMDETTQEIIKLSVEITELELINDDHQNAARVFGPAGVRARILDTVTPFLNDRTSEYLGALSDGNISAIWTTLTRKKNGDLSEKFSIAVVNDKGAESFAGLSGGEKRKVRLSTTLALQDLVASRATKPIDLMMFDEIDNALDEAGLERLMIVLEKKSRGRGTTLVISHNSLSDWIDNIAMVTKIGGTSVVSGCLSE